MTVEYNSLLGKIKGTEYSCGDSYYEIADRLGVAYKNEPIICVKNGTPILRKDWDKPVGISQDTIQFIIVPRGEVFKNIFKILALIALTVVAPYISGTLLGLTGIAATLANAAIVIGGTFLINALLGPSVPPLQSQSSQQASPTYSLEAQGNRARLLNPIPRLYGTHKLFPDFASQPYQGFENNEQYLYQLFCLGVGEYQVDKINIADTELWDRTSGLSPTFQDVELEIIPPGGTITLFPSNVNTSVEVSGQELKNYRFTDSVTFAGNRATFGDDHPEIEFLSPGDLIIISGAGANNGTFVITDKDSSGDFTWLEFGTTFTSGTLSSKTFALDDWVGPFVTNPNNQATDKLQIDVVLARGLYYANDSGGLSTATVTFTCQIRPIDNLGNPLGGYTTAFTQTLIKQTTTAQRITKTINVTRGRYEIRMRRTTEKESDSRYGNDIAWQSLRAFIPDDNIYPDVTLLAMKIRASNQLSSQSSTQINTIQRGKIPVWNGTSWSAPQNTSNPAWIAADMLRNTAYGAGLSDDRIDLSKLLELSAVYDGRGDSFNGVFDTAKTFWESLASVLSVVRSQPILVAGMITFMRDQPRALAKTVITPQSILKNTFESTHIIKGEDSADDVIVEFMDSTTWEQSEVQCTLPGSTSSKPARIEMFGVTNRSQAWREGMYYAAANSYRRVLASVTTEADGRLLLKGDPVIISHDLLQWSQSGFINDYIAAETTLICDRTVSFSSGTNYISLRRKDGREFGPITALTNGYSNEIKLEAGSLAALETAEGMTIDQVLSIDDEAKRTTFVLYDSTKYKKKFLVVGTSNKGMERTDVSLVIDDDRVYTADTGTPPPGVDYLGPGVTPNGPTVTGVIVNQNPLSGADPVLLDVSWNAASGATEYILQISHDAVNWEQLYNGSAADTQITVNAGDLYLRVAAVGTVLGPWSYMSPSPSNFGTPALTPGIVSNLNVAADISAGTLEISYTAAPRATQYVIAVYSESSIGSGNFNVLELTKTSSGTFVTFNSSEVLAAGGPWERIQVNVTAQNDYGSGSVASEQVLDITLGAVTGLALTDPYHGIEANIQWNAVSGASGYRLKIYNNSAVLVRETVVTTNSYNYSNSRLTADGGSWRNFSAQVRPESSSLVGSYVILNITDQAPAVPANIASTSPSAGQLNISYDAVPEADVTKYQVFVSTTNGFTPSAGNRVLDDNALSVSLTGLSSGTTYYYRVRTIDSYAGGDGYLTSSQFSRTVT